MAYQQLETNIEFMRSNNGSIANLMCGLTMRAADGGWAARFSAFFVALSLFRFDGESTLSPTAVTPADGRLIQVHE
jgi:hypothetical protein